MLDDLTKQFPDASITIFTSFAQDGEPGLSVSQMEELKGALREAEGEYVVAKKRLVEKALSGLKYDGLDVFSVSGSLGLVFGHGDVYAVTKALYEFSKANPSLKLFSGFMDKEALTPEQVMEMGAMPSKDELIVRLLGMLNWPLQSLAIVLNQIADAKPAEAAAEAPTETKEEPAGEKSEDAPKEESEEEPRKETPTEEKSEEKPETTN